MKTEDLAALVSRYEDVPEDYEFPTVERFELTGPQMLVYVGGLSNEHSLSSTLRVQAMFPLVPKTPASSVYDYCNLDVSGVRAPVELRMTG